MRRLDLAVYAAVAATPTPTLDRFFGRVSAAADRSRIWLMTAGVLAAVGNRTDEAVDHLTDAVAVNERAGAHPWLARSRFELALVLAERGGNGDSERAGTLLADAGRTAEELAMESLLRRMGRVETRSGLTPQNA